MKQQLKEKMKMSHNAIQKEKEFFELKKVTIKNEDDYSTFSNHFHPEIKNYVDGKMKTVECIFDDEALANLLHFKKMTIMLQERVNARSN